MNSIDALRSAAKAELWLYHGRRLIHSKALVNWQFCGVCNAIDNGTIYFAEITPEWADANDAPLPF